PDRRGVEPGYEEKSFDAAARRGRLRLIASPDGRDGSVTIHQDACVYAGLLDGDEGAEHAIAPGRRAYVHLARGELEVNGTRLAAGDALKLTRESAVRLAHGREAEVLLFDLP
ncbi:MAG TPA: pirin family protein, partial [Usitatibacter sp.]|nr:pirin family protein [Usitatibacter sp.]